MGRSGREVGEAVCEGVGGGVVCEGLELDVGELRWPSRKIERAHRRRRRRRRGLLIRLVSRDVRTEAIVRLLLLSSSSTLTMAAARKANHLCIDRTTEE